MLKQQRTAGISTVEMMISISVGIIVIFTGVSVFSKHARMSKQTIGTMRLHHELETIASMIANDIRRSGYWAATTNDIGNDQNTNPFMRTDTILRLPETDCILMSYDSNKDGLLAAINTFPDDERYGYRLANNAIQARVSDAAYSCNAPFDSWETLVNTDIIEITELSFSLSEHTVAIKDEEEENSGGNGDNNDGDGGDGDDGDGNDGDDGDGDDGDGYDRRSYSNAQTSSYDNDDGDDGDGDDGDGNNVSTGNNSSESEIIIRSIDMQISGRLKNQPEMKETLRQTIHLRNDIYKPKS